jgi:hypothetical protein
MRRSRRAALARARARLDTLDLYPAPVRMRFVRILVTPWFFRLPFLRRFDGYALHETILLRSEPSDDGGDDDLVTHELCHVWQMQHRPLAMPLSYLRSGYDGNAYEQEARAAAGATRGATYGLGPARVSSTGEGP